MAPTTATGANATRLNQIIAVLKGVKSDTNGKLTKIYHDVQKPALLAGISRTYRPVNDDDPVLPGESTRVQLRANDVVRQATSVLTRLFDVTAALEWTNTTAKADVVVDGETLIANVPATYLIFMEKQLTDLRTVVAKLPALDPAENWHWDDNGDAWATEKSETTRTQKVPHNHVVSPATDKHPAQVTVYQTDDVVGFWATTKFSGALPAARRRELVERITALIEAVKFARETANMAEVVDPKPAAAVFAWLLRN